MWSCVSRATTTATLRRQHGRLTFLNGLCQHAEELKARFDSVREQLVERMRTEDERASLRWTLRSPLDEYDLWPEADDGDNDEMCAVEPVLASNASPSRARSPAASPLPGT